MFTFELLLLAVDENPHLVERLQAVERRQHVMPLSDRQPVFGFDAERIIGPHAYQIEMDLAIDEEEAVASDLGQTVLFRLGVIAHPRDNRAAVFRLGIDPG